MPQLLTDTDSLRLVPIVATCSVTHVSHCTAQLQCTSIQGHQEEEGSTGTRWEVESVSTGSQQGFDSELKGIPQAVNRELIGSQWGVNRATAFVTCAFRTAVESATVRCHKRILMSTEEGLQLMVQQ